MSVLREQKAWRRERPKTETRRSSDLTPEEQANARRAIIFLRARLGTWPKLAAALKTNQATLWNQAHHVHVTAGLALRVARAAGVTLEDVLSGTWPAPGTCPHCGRN